MAKRFTDTAKWDKRFYRDLPNNYKLLWQFILDKCDHAGVWDIDLELISYYLKIDFNRKEIEIIFKDRLIDFHNNEKWFIPDFISFQYGYVLNEKNKAHKSVIEILLRNGLDQYTDVEIRRDKNGSK